MYVPEGVYTEYEGEHIYVPPQTFQQVPRYTIRISN